MLSLLLEVVWFTLPAWVANSIAIDVKAVPILKDLSTPMDFGRSFRGKRILGDGKTWRGLFAGIVAGTLTGALQAYLSPGGLPVMSCTLGFLMGSGALIGDFTASFLKRRMGFDRGDPLIILDTMDYIVGAYFFAWMIVPVNTTYLVLAGLLTIPFHTIANFVAYFLKLKKNPW
ncbi:CDP-2,3-bis-(O-geranylgeranyl)-sn-glycerol synthase [Candidatus Altiarchaeota archaeon]